MSDSQYHAAFQDSTAKELALKTFTAIDTLWHCPDCGGYQETPANSFPAESVGVGIGLKQQDPEAGLVRTFNTLLHGIEALTALHKVTAGAWWQQGGYPPGQMLAHYCTQGQVQASCTCSGVVTPSDTS